jgi:hypothetical protein
MSAVTIRRSLLVTVLSVVACGDGVGATDVPAAPATPTGTVSGTITVHLGTNLQDQRTEPVSARVLLFPIQPFARDWPYLPAGDALADTRSAADGTYSLRAPPGTYTLLVHYGPAYEPRSTDTEGWNPVQVIAGESVKKDVYLEHNSDF